MTQDTPLPSPHMAPPRAQAAPPTYDAQALTQGGTTACITLNEQIYCLRITRQGKLILTK